MRIPARIRIAARSFALVPVFVLVAAACSDGPAPETAADWADAVETRLVDDSVERSVVDCVLNVARVELERSPLSEAATEELITNCEKARAVIDGTDTEPDPSVALAMTDQPFTFGDDPTLDALWTSCEEGSGESCDQLFAAAPVGSEYEEFGVSCGHRPELLHCDALDVVEEDGENAG